MHEYTEDSKAYYSHTEWSLALIVIIWIAFFLAIFPWIPVLLDKLILPLGTYYSLYFDWVQKLR